MIKAVIFDLDGTLLNTYPDLHVAMNAMLKEFALPPISEAEVKSFIGYGAKQYVQSAIPQNMWDKTDECLAVYNKIYDEGKSPLTRLYDGIDILLKKLKKMGIKLAIVSNKPQTSTDEVYARYLKDYQFDYVYGQRPNFETKPSAQPTLFVLKELGLKPEEAVFVGDGETDMQTAINSGVTAIGVLWGYRNEQQLKMAGGKYFAADAEILLQLIQKFCNEKRD